MSVENIDASIHDSLSQLSVSPFLGDKVDEKEFDSDSSEPRVSPENFKNEVKDAKTLKKRFKMDRKKYGLSDVKTLKAAFELIDVLIGLYRLDDTDHLLKDLVPVCKEVGEKST